MGQPDRHADRKRLAVHPFAALQRLLPQHGLSRLLGVFAASGQRHLKWLLIEGFKSAYSVEMTEFDGDTAVDFASFNDFFARPLLPGTRPLPSSSELAISPADGVVSQAGEAANGELLQAKGHTYAITDLVGDEAFAATLSGGSFVTVYLAPHNYHRVHVPCDADLVSTLEIPGSLFSVNAVTERHIPGLFARNERLVLRLRASFGEFALVLIGAMIVASIDVSWPNGPVSPYRRRATRTPVGVVFQRGDEIGAFRLGSTVVAVFPPGAVTLAPEIQTGCAVQVGTSIGRITHDPSQTP